MKKAYLLILFFINLFLSSCSKEKLDDNSPLIITDYSISVRLTDLTGNNLTMELPLEILSEYANGVKEYTIKEGDSHFYLDGKEMIPLVQEGVERDKILFRRVTVQPSTSRVTPCIDFTFGYLPDFTEFTPGKRIQPTHTYEYRFTLPSMFGEEEQVITIQCEARNFYTPAYRKVFINGVESENNDINDITLIVDKD